MAVTGQEIATNVMSWEDYTDGRFRARLGEHGYLFLRGLPAGFDYVAFLRQYGALMPQYDGELIWSIRAIERYDNLYHSLNTKGLMPHTECYEFAGVPPKYLALWCLEPASDPGGQTTVADLREFLRTLTQAERGELAAREYEFVSSAGVQDMRLGLTARHPVLEERPGLPAIFRFSYNCVVHEDDPFLLDIRERVLRFFKENHVCVDYARGDLLIWDNHRTIHSRTAYSDRGRHLRRVWLAES